MFSTVLDRELDEEKGLHPSGPRICCPLCGWSPRKDNKWFCICGCGWNTFDTGGVCSACCTNGLRLSASLAADGRCIRTGMRSKSASLLGWD
jgi:hypothetical protein